MDNWYVTNRVLFSSGNQRLGRYLWNAGRMGWAFAWIEYVTQQYYLCKKKIIICIRVTVPDPILQRPMYWGLVFFTDIQRHKAGTSVKTLRLPFPSSFPNSSPHKLQDTRTGLYLHTTLHSKYKYKYYAPSHKNSLASPYNVKCSSFVTIKIQLFFNVIPKDIFFICLVLGRVQNPVAVKSWLLFWQTFTNSHFYFLIIA